MDAIDRKILAVLQQDASLSVAEIGNRVGLSSTPCWKRIQKLEAEGVIQKRVAVVDPERVGLGVTVFVAIETGDHSEEWLARFAEAVRAMPEVMEFYRMAGDVDYMLRVAVSSIQDYDGFYKRLIAAIPLKNVTSRFAMERIKQTTALPIPTRIEHDAAARSGLKDLSQFGAGLSPEHALAGRHHAVAGHAIRQARPHVDLVLQVHRAGDDVADRRRVGVFGFRPDQRTCSRC